MLNTREKMADIRERLEERLLIGDGTMGTLLAERRGEHTRNMVNLTHAQVVRDLPGLDAVSRWRRYRSSRLKG